VVVTNYANRESVLKNAFSVQKLTIFVILGAVSVLNLTFCVIFDLKIGFVQLVDFAYLCIGAGEGLDVGNHPPVGRLVDTEVRTS
jgi:hypothetical protein